MLRSLDELKAGQRYIFREVSGVTDRFVLIKQARPLRSGDVVELTAVVPVATRLFNGNNKELQDIRIAIKGCCDRCDSGNPHHMFSIEEGSVIPYFEKISYHAGETKQEELKPGRLQALDLMFMLMDLTELSAPSIEFDADRTIHIGTTKYTAIYRNGGHDTLLISQKSKTGMETTRGYSDTEFIPDELSDALVTMHKCREKEVERATKLVNETNRLLEEVHKVENEHTEEIAEAVAIN